jgi:hypothetical protein
MIFPRFLQISWLFDPFSRLFDYHYRGRHKGYCCIKFGRNGLVNKNFTALGVSKNLIFPSFSQFSRLSDRFFRKCDYCNVGRQKVYLGIKFGRNRLVNKNFIARGIKKRDFSHFFSTISVV